MGPTCLDRAKGGRQFAAGILTCMRSTCAIPNNSTPTFFGRLRAATCNFTGLAAALLLVLSVFLAPSAAAHDVLVSSDPEDGAEVEDLTSLTLTFNNDPLDVNPIIAISGPDGQEKALDLTPMVDGRDVYVEFSDLDPGEYAVSWRVVSSDGHPIEGNQTFTILEGANAEEPGADEPSDDDEPATDPDESVSSDDEGEEPTTETPDDAESDSADSDDTSSNADAESDADEDEDSGFSPMIWLALAIAVAVALGLFGSNASKKKRQETDDQTPSKS